MEHTINEINQLMVKGELHVFSIKDKKYLYVSSINRFFELDDIAYGNFVKIKQGENLSPEHCESFLKEFGSLKIQTTSSVTEPFFLRIYISNDNHPNDVEHEIKKLLNSGATIHKCEFIVSLNENSFQNYTTVLSDLLFPFKEIWDVYKIKTTIAVKAIYHFFTPECISYLNSRRIIPIIQFSYQNYLEQQPDNFTQLGANHVQLIKSNFKNHNLNENFKNFVVLDTEVTSLNYPELLNDLTKILDVDAEAPIPESFQNVLRIFKALTSKVILPSIILSSESKPESSKCSSCWAQKICQLSAVYESFGNTPQNVSINPLNCDLLRKLTENLINLINVSQIQMQERTLRKQTFELENERILTLVNP